ncbi:hypothetical protein chiPu_0033487, partial [Chiloscyllium punctatum]|nr:hypothetical protein [Chiloscyllium punctatum]
MSRARPPGPRAVSEAPAQAVSRTQTEAANGPDPSTPSTDWTMAAGTRDRRAGVRPIGERARLRLTGARTNRRQGAGHHGGKGAFPRAGRPMGAVA